MPEIETLRSLLARVEKAEGPDRELDAEIQIALIPDFGARMETSPPRYVRFDDVWRKNRADHVNHANNVSDWWKCPKYTASIDAVVALIERALPGWYWRVASCHLSDDAWVAPDYNDPAHAERLAREFPPALPDWTEITDVDRRPAGQPALALIEALLRALIAKEEGRVV